MTAEEKRLAVRKMYDSILGRNWYSQPRRNYCFTKYKDGKYYSDCSSSVSYCYKKAGFSFGILNTVGMYNSKKFVKVDVEIKNGIPQDMSKLRVGDMLLFAGTDKSRSGSGYVGHVEMVYSLGATAAKSKICGHGGTHPRVTTMSTYCTSRYKSKTSTKRGNKGLIKIVRFIQDDSAYEPIAPSFTPIAKGDKGNIVKNIQEILVKLGYDIGKYGIDGDYGEDTEKAVKAFQKASGLEATGLVDEQTYRQMDIVLNPPKLNKFVRIVNGTCFIRDAAGTNGDKIGTTPKGVVFKWLETAENGWNKIELKAPVNSGWVSPKYSAVYEE